jgi:hypothetical protein
VELVIDGSMTAVRNHLELGEMAYRSSLSMSHESEC